MIERSFSEISAHYKKQGNRIHAETLCDIHRNAKSSINFIEALQTTATAYKIDFEK